MKSKCWVKNCPTKIRSKPKPWPDDNAQENRNVNLEIKQHYFSAPKEQLWRWQEVFPAQKLKPSSYLCQLHFKEEDLLKNYVTIVSGEVNAIPRGKWSLKPGALPQNCDNKEPTSPRTPFGNVTHSPNANGSLTTSSPKPSVSVSSLLRKTPPGLNINSGNQRTEIPSVQPCKRKLFEMELADPGTISNLHVSVAETLTVGQVNSPVCTPICNNQSQVNPIIATPICNNQSQVNPIIATPTCICNNQSQVNPIIATPICNKQSQSNPTTCTPTCLHKTKCLYLKKRLNASKKLIAELRRKISSLESANEVMSDHMVPMDKLPPKQKLVVSEALRNSQAKSVYGHRFSKDWLLDALLLKIKSPSLYEFLRINEYLPLPSVSTLNNSIRSLEASFGFDDVIFETLKNKLESMPEKERHGVLLFDEMQISRHLDFRPNEAKIIGRVDYGGIEYEAHDNKYGDHALVFLFQPMCGGWVQSLGSFCSSGATPAPVLTKLILQAIIKLHKSNVIVDGIVCDGASGNRSTLKTLGMQAEVNKELVNYFPHPCQDSKIFFFLRFYTFDKMYEKQSLQT